MFQLIASALVLPVLAAAAVPDNSATPTVAATEAGAEDPGNQIKCRKIKVTGSLVRSEKICKTLAEWQRLRESGNAAARDITDYSRSRPLGQ